MNNNNLNSRRKKERPYWANILAGVMFMMLVFSIVSILYLLGAISMKAGIAVFGGILVITAVVVILMLLIRNRGRNE